MILLDIENIENNIKKHKPYKLKFIDNYGNQNFQKSLIIPNKEIEIKFISFIGKGSYGQVYKIEIDSNFYALKFSENEVPNKLKNRFNSLINNNTLKPYTINILFAGEVKCEFTYPYYSIMEYGGCSLRNYLEEMDSGNIKNIINQLYEIVTCIYNNKILMTDFKLSNLTIDKQNKIKLIDIYLDCENYNPCRGCKIIKTYSTIEIDKEKKIYENSNYNYSYIFIPFAMVIIDIVCKNTIYEYSKIINKKFNLNINLKQLIPLLQIACYNFINNNNDPIKIYQNMYKHKKKLEKEYSIIKEPEFYNFFINLLEPQKVFESFISKKKLCLIITDLISVDPSQRSIRFFSKLIE